MLTDYFFEPLVDVVGHDHVSDFFSAARTAATCVTMSTDNRPSAVMFRMPRICPSMRDSLASMFCAVFSSAIL